MECTLSVHRGMKGVSSRVTGTFLKEAFEWDPNVVIPEELSDVEKVVVLQTHPSLPVRQRSLTRERMRQSGWKEHKKACTYKSQDQGMN